MSDPAENNIFPSLVNITVKQDTPIPDPNNILEERGLTSADIRRKLGEEFIPVKVTGKGASGVIVEVYDTVKQDNVAAKIFAPSDIVRQQQAHRNISNDELVIKEAKGLQSLDRVINRELRIINGEPIIFMDLAKGSVQDVYELRRGVKPTQHYGNMSLEEVMSITQQMATGLSEIHTKLEKPHADFKIDNLLVDQFDGIQVGDFGSSTMIYEPHSGPRDGVGHPYIRAPELYEEGSAPDYESDVWSLGSCLFKLLTGYYPLEKEINATSPEQAMKLLKDDPKYIERKIKHVPRICRSILRTSLSLKSHERQKNAEVWREEFKRIYNRRTGWMQAVEKVKDILPFAAVIGILGYTLISTSPRIPYPEEREFFTQPKTERTFDYEPIQWPKARLPPSEEAIQDTKSIWGDSLIRQLTIAYVTAHGEVKSEVPLYDAHQRLKYMRAHPGMNGAPRPAFVIRTNIEHALEEAEGENKVVDFEDFCALTILNDKEFRDIQKRANATKWEDYKQVIPRPKRKFIELFAAYARKVTPDTPDIY